MSNNNLKTVLAKITLPRSENCLPRERLFNELDQARQHKAVWIGAPAGAGKTMLASSYLQSRQFPSLWYQVDEGDGDIASFFYYMGQAAEQLMAGSHPPLPLLTPEYRGGSTTFVRNYFRELYSRIKNPTVIVLDNYQEVPEDSALHDILQCAIAELPPSVSMMILSRQEPPAQFVRLRAHGEMTELVWEQLRLTLPESIDLVEQYGNQKVDRATIQKIHAQTQGWAVGLILLLESASEQDLSHSSHDGDGRQKLFDYFAGELLYKVDEPTRNFLLKTALLPSITVTMAAELAAEPEAEKVLRSLAYGKFFLTAHESHEQGYRYHPLFREFLLIQAGQVFSKTTLRETQQHAARLLAEAGRVEDAVKLYQAAGDWTKLQELLMATAPALLAQGRWQTLLEWLLAMPGNILAASPWMQYWLGVAQFFNAPQESVRAFEAAFNEFRRQNASQGMFLAWAGLMEAVIYSFVDFGRLDAWIEVLEAMLQEDELPNGEAGARVASAMHMALVIRQPQHPDIGKWAQRVLADSQTDPRVRGITLFEEAFHALGIGDRAKLLEAQQGLTTIMDSTNSDPMLAANYYLVTAWSQMQGGDYLQAIHSLQEGLAITQASGMHLMDCMLLGHCVLCAVHEGDSVAAEQFIKDMTPWVDSARPWDQSFYHFVLAWKTIHEQKPDEALSHCNIALKLARQVGASFSTCWCYLMQAQIRYTLGDDTDAHESLRQAIQIADRIQSKAFDFGITISEAWFALQQGQREAGLDYLTRAFALGRQGYTNYYLWQPEVMAGLCIEALQAGIEPGYAQHLIRKRRLVPGNAPVHLANWPWQIKIYTLGRFAVVRNGEPLSFAGKGHKKPLELLKALIAFGGREVNEEKLSETLWPDADGDAAHRNFTSNLHRLRKLLGPEILLLKDACLTLDAHYCWVDVWAFERILSRLGVLLDQADVDKKDLHPLMEQALALYQDHFLGKTGEQSWSISLREHLRHRWLRTVKRLIHYLGHQQSCAQAIVLYERALELDDLAEDMYRGLMGCYAAQQRQAESLAVYGRCQTILHTVMGIKPSAETEAVHQAIQNGDKQTIAGICERCCGLAKQTPQ